MQGERVFYEVALNRLDEQLRRADSIDTKANNTITFGTAVVALSGTVLATGNLPTGNARGVFVAAIVTGLAAFGCVIYFAIQSYRTRGYSLRPLLMDLQDFSADHSEADTQKAVAEQCTNSVSTNEPILKAKADNFDRALYAFPAEAACLFIAAVISLWAR